MRPVRPELPAEAAPEAAPEPVPQPGLRSPRPQGEDPRVPGVRKVLQAQGQPHQAHGAARPGLKRAREYSSSGASPGFF